MQIKYVVSTMVFWGQENSLSLEQDCQYLKSLGFGVELWPTVRGNGCRYERWNWPRLAAATEGMTVSMHSRIDRPDLKQWDEQIQCAELIGANIVAGLPSLGITDKTGLDGCDFAAEVIKIADARNVRLCVETGNLSAVKQLGERFDSIYYCLDTGYAHLDSEFGFRQYVDQLIDRTAHLHLTDNYGRIDDHEPPGLKGGIPERDWKYLLRALQKSGNEIVASLEMFPSMPGVMIRKAEEFLFDKLLWPNRPGKASPYPAAVSYNRL